MSYQLNKRQKESYTPGLLLEAVKYINAILSRWTLRKALKQTLYMLMCLLGRKESVFTLIYCRICLICVPRSRKSLRA